ncbi:MAG: hypothetical protein JW751_03245, partial [Polyangiaceae bacterium]|nr:hypothetical protein [Polyangiaceae bacterium]
EVVLMFRWHGRATVEVPRAVSTQTTMDVHAGGPTQIPLHEMGTGEIARRGQYAARELIVTEKDGSVAGRSEPASPVLIELLCEAFFARGLFRECMQDYGFGDGTRWMAVYGDLIVEGVKRGLRDYHSGLGIRFVARASDQTNPVATDRLSILFRERVVEFGESLVFPGMTRFRVVGPGVDLNQNIYCWEDRVVGEMWCVIGLSSLFFRKQIGTPDGDAFDQAYGPVGVRSGPGFDWDGPDWTPPTPEPRRVNADGSVTGQVNEIDEAHTMVVLQPNGLPVVQTINPVLVPPQRAADIQRAMRAFIWANATIGAHELGHYLGLVSTREPGNRSSITVAGKGTWESPLNGDAEGHNRIPTSPHLMNPGPTIPCSTLFGLDGIDVGVEPINRQYLADCLPQEA